MSTLSALYVATEDAERLIDALRAYAAGPDGKLAISERLDDEAAFYRGDLLFESFATRPRNFLIGVQQPGWVTAHVGAFEGVGELADALSAELDVRVVVGQGQTTSEAWRVSVHEKGRTLRHVEYADGEWLAQHGTPFAFEPRPLGTNGAEPGDEPFYDFGFDETAAFCRDLGFVFWSDRQPEDGWILLRGGEIATPPSDDARGVQAGGGAPRSWWRRLLGS